MSISGILKHYQGYLTVSVEGLYLEKFLNMAVANGIEFWDVKRLSMTEMELKLSIKSYRSIKKFLGRTGCQVYIEGKRGLPFSILKVRRRVMLGIGFTIFIFLIFMLSSFIWSVNVTGAKTIDTDEIVKNLSELGVRAGAFKPGISVSQVENNMLIRMKSISWIKVKIIGTRADIEIVERVPPPEVISQDKPCNIVARCDGIIVKAVAGKGNVLVSPGDPVRKGQLLVSGVLEKEGQETRYVHSIADVEARTWHDMESSVPLEYSQWIRTGNKKTGVYLIAGSKKYTVRNSNIRYKTYDKIIKNIKLINTKKFQFPLEIIIEQYYETSEKKVKLSSEEAKSKAVDIVEKEIIDNISPDAKIINKKINVTIKDNKAYAAESVETVEDIGQQAEIK